MRSAKELIEKQIGTLREAKDVDDQIDALDDAIDYLERAAELIDKAHSVVAKGLGNQHKCTKALYGLQNDLTDVSETLDDERIDLADDD